MPDPTPNLPLLRKVFDHITAHPEEWYQGHWAVQTVDAIDERPSFWADHVIAKEGQRQAPSCGTTFCFAGHALAMSGAVPEFSSRGTAVTFVVDGEQTSPFDAGQKALGLTYDEAYDLFSGCNGLSDIRENLESIAARACEVF